MGLRRGYKKTDIGVIPEDWTTQALRPRGSLTKGSGVRKNEANSGSIPCVRYGEIYTDHNEIIKVFRSLISRQVAHSAHRLLSGDIIFAASGETKEEIGKCVAFVGDHEAYAGGDTIIYSPRVDDPRFLGYALNQPLAARQKAARGQGDAVVHISTAAIGDLCLAFPPLPEQRAIAAALSDVDAALAGLGQLVAKKRDVKQAAMLQLLTGQTRLPGFIGDWAVKRLRDHVSFLRNGMHSRSQLTRNDPVRYLHYGDIHTASTIRLNPGATEMPRLPTAEAGRLSRLVIGDVVFVDASEDLDGVGKSLEIVGDGDLEIVAGQHTIAARFDKETVADGFKGYLQFIPDFSSHLRRLAAGTKVYATNRTHIASAEIKLPEPDEQVAIAAALSDMESEIAALEVQRDKMRMLKQAMMQALLTGRIRLPVDQDDTAVAVMEAANG
jgi:type I restriction enzyme S subunit